MLILVAVTVNVAVNSGLFRHAQDATGGYSEKQAQEQAIGDGTFNIVVNGVTYTSLEEYLAANPGATVPGGNVGTGETIDPADPSNPSGATDPTLTTDRSSLKVGDYIEYTPDTVSTPYSLTSAVSGYGSEDSPQSIPQDTLQWRVMSINEDGSVDLISATPTSTNVYFQGALGYNNCVAVLNGVCEEQYSNASLGVTARSINIEDIENKFSDEGSTAKTAYINDVLASLSGGTTTIQSVNTANNTVTYATRRSQYPDIYQYENGSGINTTTVKTNGIGGSETYSGYTNGITTNTSGNANTSGLTVTQTHYYFSNIPANYFTDSTFHDLVFGTGETYWLASRCVNCNNSRAAFDLLAVIREVLGFNYLYSSSGGTSSTGCLVRPVVSLGSNIRISTEGGTAENPRAISL